MGLGKIIKNGKYKIYTDRQAESIIQEKKKREEMATLQQNQIAEANRARTNFAGNDIQMELEKQKLLGFGQTGRKKLLGI